MAALWTANLVYNCCLDTAYHEEPKGCDENYRVLEEQRLMFQLFWKRLIRFGFRLLYNEMAWSYDAVSWLVSFGSWREWQKSALSFVTGERILEVGHGPGHLLAALESDGRRPVGLDLSSSMGRLAKRRAAAPLVQGRVEALPFRGASFDAALSTFPTDYIVSPEALSAVYQALKPGGLFIVLPEAHLTGSSPFHLLIEWLFQITGQRQGPAAVDETSQGPLPDKWQVIQQRFEAAGFALSRRTIRKPRSVATILIAEKAKREDGT